MHFFALATAAASLLTTASAATITVLVGSNGTATGTVSYFPSSVTAQAGDQIAFQFVAGNHTVTQSTFAAPCTQSGITSGFQPFTAGSSQVAEWSFNVSDSTTPLWFFCEHVGHCAAGMVFSVNAPSTGKTFDAFQAAAKATGSTSASSSASASASGTPAPQNGALMAHSGSVGVLAVAAGLVAGLLL